MPKIKQEIIQLGIKPKKSFGQNFLIDPYYNSCIVQAIKKIPNFTNQTIILEIGAGTGALTCQLVDNFSHVYTLEKDRDLIPILQQKFYQEIKNNKLVILEQNILKFNLTNLYNTNTRGIITGNLPYHLTSSILFILLEHWEYIYGAVFLIQKEVADRLAASPNTKNYGFLTVLLQLAFKISKISHVPRQAFWPIPKVDSQIIKLEQQDLGISQIKNQKNFFNFVKIIFQQRRKKLSTILKKHITPEINKNININLNLRPENLSPQQFVSLYQILQPTT